MESVRTTEHTKIAPSIHPKKDSLKLERMQLPKFNGSLRDYIRFKDDFTKFVIPEVEATEAEVEAAEKCGEGTHLEDGVCILDESSSVESTPGESTPGEAEPASTDFNSWIYSITFTLLIAFVIAIFLYLISRVRGKKTV